ncbi:hypothetical protein P280DRAFT_464329 [Massarina eburnea CBS 473.64]|uniref:Uncharacterized protein n=1 Tax=Massarina eburnea CBS 473.64 TaxID=1395130 RepID=A0A6A6SGK3_9PLEO|nr:hypothetical protein P280DRAFT_464329 [Massarina eburnea CBS 473.64]
MGVPYSREIDAAFLQVTPLVQQIAPLITTAKVVVVVIALVQVFVVGLLCAILGVLVAGVVCVNPDLERERRKLVTPAVKWLVRRTRWDLLRGLLFITIPVIFAVFLAVLGFSMWG